MPSKTNTKTEICMYVFDMVAIEWLCFRLGKRRREKESEKRWKIGNGKLTKVVQRLFRTRSVWRHSDGDNSFHVEMPSHTHGTHEQHEHTVAPTHESNSYYSMMFLIRFCHIFTIRSTYRQAHMGWYAWALAHWSHVTKQMMFVSLFHFFLRLIHERSK